MATAYKSLFEAAKAELVEANAEITRLNGVAAELRRDMTGTIEFFKAEVDRLGEVNASLKEDNRRQYGLIKAADYAVENLSKQHDAETAKLNAIIADLRKQLDGKALAPKTVSGSERQVVTLDLIPGVDKRQQAQEFADLYNLPISRVCMCGNVMTIKL